MRLTSFLTLCAFVSSVLAFPPSASAVEVDEVRHPKTGEPGIWVSSALFAELDEAHIQLPRLKELVAVQRVQIGHLKKSLQLQIRTTTTAQQRADLWEAKADELFADKERLLMKTGEPWWATVLKIGGGMAVMGAAVSLSKGL